MKDSCAMENTMNENQKRNKVQTSTNLSKLQHHQTKMKDMGKNG